MHLSFVLARALIPPHMLCHYPFISEPLAAMPLYRPSRLYQSSWLYTSSAPPSHRSHSHPVSVVVSSLPISLHHTMMPIFSPFCIIFPFSFTGIFLPPSTPTSEFPHVAPTQCLHSWLKTIVDRHSNQWLGRELITLPTRVRSRARRRELLGVKTWLSTLEIVNLLCLSDETLKAVGPFYMASMPGEVKDPTQMCNLSWTPHSNLEKDNSKPLRVSPKMGCLVYTN